MVNEAGAIGNALGETFNEVTRAKNLHPGDFHNAHEGFAVLKEEVDELWENVKLNPKRIDVSLVYPAMTPDDVVAKMRQEKQCEIHRQRMREEAIQVAAMAIRFAAELT
jgi:hypothetical protein